MSATEPPTPSPEQALQSLQPLLDALRAQVQRPGLHPHEAAITLGKFVECLCAAVGRCFGLGLVPVHEWHSKLEPLGADIHHMAEYAYSLRNLAGHNNKSALHITNKEVQLHLLQVGGWGVPNERNTRRQT